ncbi:hypothetical protein [Streptomyces violascens]|uniref:Uncharacterized protein n=1 Tax=Streptomyces violascens TaxID=67381 RepID=A0ABQ3QTD7_9ACTN|nr:hypothetical protein [Streptomyces violascens]GHI40533.1 hypothetical protein Sviol_49410 [Streptomyces violascens]
MTEGRAPGNVVAQGFEAVEESRTAGLVGIESAQPRIAGVGALGSGWKKAAKNVGSLSKGAPHRHAQVRDGGRSLPRLLYIRGGRSHVAQSCIAR